VVTGYLQGIAALSEITLLALTLFWFYLLSAYYNKSFILTSLKKM